MVYLYKDHLKNLSFNRIYTVNLTRVIGYYFIKNFKTYEIELICS